MSRDDDFVEVSGTLLATTALAILVQIESVDGDDAEGEELWIPRSLLADDVGGTKGDEIEVFVQRWFLDKEGAL